jgi:hypothetical protein
MVRFAEHDRKPRPQGKQYFTAFKCLFLSNILGFSPNSIVKFSAGLTNGNFSYLELLFVLFRYGLTLADIRELEQLAQLELEMVIDF